MSKLVAAVLFIAKFAVAGLAMAFLLTRLFPDRFGPLPPPPSSTPVPAAASSYAEAVNRAGPWVVSISAERLLNATAAPLFGDPAVRRFSEAANSPVRQLERSLGSGVIFSADGYVLTNFHVVANAQRIRIGLWDERVTEATLVGGDLETDLAVLKIDGDHFPTATFADADKLAVGDVVLAIGNPYGYDRTVTMGIISATKRNNLGRTRFEDYLQTDAAVNSGNSGGALVNTRGELVGINTGNLRDGLSIGFAIPAQSAKEVLDKIVKYGEVIRGWMGAEYADAPYSPAEGSNAAQRGAQVALLLTAGPADLAGIKPGDIITEFDGQPVLDGTDLRLHEAALAPGTEVNVAGTRAGIPFSVPLKLIRRPGNLRSK
ncbi:MAG: peptidase S1 [Lysobacterales bacterium CG02_land_8_20_14_3_00_62_12]|nr:MAG: peptidase S1 [Xanthomonadales bacterium CG02_land_8_20_14_3_00_62_12]